MSVRPGEQENLVTPPNPGAPWLVLDSPRWARANTFRDNGPHIIWIIGLGFPKAHLIGKTLASVLAQHFRDFEVIFVDYAGQDKTRGVKASIKKSQPRTSLTR